MVINTMQIKEVNVQLINYQNWYLILLILIEEAKSCPQKINLLC